MRANAAAGHVLIGAWLLVTLGLSYIPDAGRGFLRDDFRWLVQYEILSPSDIAAAFTKDNGFYRPLVGLSFAAERALFAANPRPYGLTNVVLVVLTALALMWLVRTLGLPILAAILAASAWALDPHGVPMAVFWISGRTALLLCIFSILAVVAALRRRRLLTFLACLAAMLSKEEAVLLPAMLFVTCLTQNSDGTGAAWRSCLRENLVPLSALGAYLLLRSRTSAMLPHSAPAYYQFSADPALLLQNVIEYADRAATFTVALLLVGCLLVWRRPRPDSTEWRILGLGAAWAVLGYGLTLFVPVRSSLYACFPAVGVALGGAAIATALWRSTPEASRWRLVVGLAVLAAAIVPVHWQRSVRWVRPARVSQTVMTELASWEHKRGANIVLQDARGDPTTLARSFGTHFQDAARLYLGDPIIVARIDPPVPGEHGDSVAKPGEEQRITKFVFENGHVRPLSRE